MSKSGAGTLLLMSKPAHALEMGQVQVKHEPQGQLENSGCLPTTFHMEVLGVWLWCGYTATELLGCLETSRFLDQASSRAAQTSLFPHE